MRRAHTSISQRSAVVLVLCALATSCGRSPVAAPARPSAAGPVANASSLGTQDAVARSEQPTAGQPAARGASGAASVAPADPERMILLTPVGPIVVHLEITIDGKPQRSVAQRVLDKVTATIGAKEQADATWTQLVDNPQFQSGVLGNAPLGDAAARQRAIKEFDFNHDGRVQRGELAALLAQDFARGRLFCVDWAAAVGQDQGNTPLFALLDEDEDGRLSQAEMSAAPVRLRSRDVDDNDAVTLADLRLPEPPRRNMRYRGDASPSRAFELRAATLDSIYYTVGELYDVGNGLDAQCFALAPGLFAALDADQSGAIGERELAGLLNVRPDLVIKATFALDSASRTAPTVELAATSDDLAAAGMHPQTAAGRITLDLPQAKLEIYAVDVAAEAPAVAMAGALFARLDVDKNQLLDSEELAKSEPPMALSLKEADENGNGQLSLDELTKALAGRANYRALQVDARAGEATDPLFDWLDAQSDWRLTSRELSGAAKRLAQLDKNGDGGVTSDEVPNRLYCAIVRGPHDANRMTPPPPPPAGRLQPAADVPRWLAAMDTNGDGEISRREFLGTPEQFATRDADGDGFLDAAEASPGLPAAGASAPAKATSPGGP